MFSRCPQCQTVHKLSAAHLATASGLVCCGHCNCRYSALEQLFDYWPDSKSAPATTDTAALPPVLGVPPKIGPATIDGQDHGLAALPEDPHRRWWLALLVLLGLTTLANVAWTFKAPLLEKAPVRTWLQNYGLLEKVAPEEMDAKPPRDLSLLHLVSRDLHQHPTRAGMLALSVVFVNRAPQAQPYPVIRLSLKNAANEVLALRRFSAHEYLPPGAFPVTGMPPDVHIPILLEFADPGSGATGFELEFE